MSIEGVLPSTQPIVKGCTAVRPRSLLSVIGEPKWKQLRSFWAFECIQPSPHSASRLSEATAGPTAFKL